MSPTDTAAPTRNPQTRSAFPQEILDRIAAYCVPTEIQAMFVWQELSTFGTKRYLRTTSSNAEQLRNVANLLQIQAFRAEVIKLLRNSILYVNRTLPLMDAAKELRAAKRTTHIISQYQSKIPASVVGNIGRIRIQHVKFVALYVGVGYPLPAVWPPRNNDRDGGQLVRITSTFSRIGDCQPAFELRDTSFDYHAECHVPASTAPRVIHVLMREYQAEVRKAVAARRTFETPSAVLQHAERTQGRFNVPELFMRQPGACLIFGIAWKLKKIQKSLLERDHWIEQVYSK